MTDEPDSAVLLCCLLGAHPGQEAALSDHQNCVLAFIPAHDGALVQRARSDGTDGQPNEVQIYWFTNQAAFEGYRDDPRSTELSVQRDRVIARTELFPVTII
ncbi:MAG: hypothetical protein ABI137_02410 [Antricoccus sp.]